MAIPDLRVTILDHTGSNVQILDASGDLNRATVKYEALTTGCGSATLEIGLRMEEVENRGYWTGPRNIVEISTGDCTLAVAAFAGAGKYYLTEGTWAFDPSQGEEAQVAYFWDGATLTMRCPVTGIGSDSGGAYITTGAPIGGGGNPTQIPAYAAGTIVGRRRYSGYIMRVDEQNDKAPQTTITCAGCAQRLNEAVGTFTYAAQDVGSAIGLLIGQFAARWPELGAGVYPTTGFQYTGSKDRVTVSSMITELMSAINNGDQWVVRVGHDRTPRLMQIFVSATNTYTYVVTLPQGVTSFEPIQFKATAHDASQLYNSVEVIGDTNSTTNQPARAIVQDTVSIALYGQIDASPVTNTALKSDAACAAYARALLLQQSIATSSNSFRVYTRNDATVTGAPGGMQRGDLVRGVAAIVVSRFDATGSSANEIPDSEFRYASGAGSLWTLSNAYVGVGYGPGGSNVVIASNSSATALGVPIDVVPGQVWTFACILNSSGATKGQVEAQIVSGSTTLATVSIAPNTSSNQLITFAIPAGISSVQVLLSANGSDGTPSWTQPNLVRGSVPKPYAPNYAFSNLYGLASNVTTTYDAIHLDSWQDVKFAAVQPDANVAIKAQANTTATSLLQNTAPKTSVDQYNISSGGFSWSSNGLVVTAPSFLATFASGTPVQGCGGNTFTLAPSSTNWVWLNPGNTWTVNQGPTTVPGAILYGIFQTSGAAVVGATQKAATSLIRVGYGNVNAASALPAPTIAGGGWNVGNGASANGMSADVQSTVSVTNVPTDGSVGGLLWLFRVSGQTPSAPWVPYGETNLSSTQAAQTSGFDFGGLNNGATYDFAVAYVGLAGYGPLTSTPYLGWTAKTIGIPTSYQLGGVAITPAISNGGVSSAATANGVNTAVGAQFTITNQPTDGSLSRVQLWVRPSSLGGSNTIGGNGFSWSPYSGQPAVGVGTTPPPAAAAYSILVADLTLGQTYDFGVSFENAQGGESSIGVIQSGFTPGLVAIPPSSTTFSNLLVSQCYGLTVDQSSGFLVMPALAEIFPAATPQKLTGSNGIYAACTSVMRFQLSSTSQHAALVLFSDAAANSNSYNNGYMLQWTGSASGNGTLAIYKRVNGSFTQLAAFSAPYTVGSGGFAVNFPGVPPLDTAWHELKFVIGSDVAGSAGGGITLSAYFDGLYIGYAIDRSSPFLSGICGPGNRDASTKTLIDPADFSITTSAGKYAENAAGSPSFSSTIQSAEQTQYQQSTGTTTDTSAIASGAVTRRTTTGSSQQAGGGGNLVFNPTAALNVSGWSTYSNSPGPVFSRDSYFGGRFDITIPAGSNSGGPDALYQQSISVLGNATMTCSGIYELGGVASGGFVTVDVVGVVSGSTYASAPACTGIRQDFAFTFTTVANETGVSVRLRVNSGSGSPSIASSGYFYKIKLEYGAVATIHDDDTATGILTTTHQPSAGPEGSFLASGIVNSRHMQTLTNSSFLNAQLSINGYADGTGTLSATTSSSNQSSITLQWPAFNIRLTDGSAIALAAGSIAASGFAGNSTYYGYFWYTKVLNSSYGSIAVTGGYLQFAAFAAKQSTAFVAALNRDGNVAVSVSLSITTPAAPASGSSSPSSGSGGGTTYCPARWQLIETLERGFVRADALRPGMHVRDPDCGWNAVRATRIMRETLAEVTVAGETIAVEIGHLWLRAGGDPDGRSRDWIETRHLSIDTLLSGRVDGAERIVPVEAIRVLGAGEYVRLTVERNRLMIGRVVSHNFVTT